MRFDVRSKWHIDIAVANAIIVRVLHTTVLA